MSKVDNFEVLREMANRNLDINLAPITQILRMNKTRFGCEITIGAPAELMQKITLGNYGGGLLAYNVSEFEALKKEMESAQGEN